MDLGAHRHRAPALVHPVALPRVAPPRSRGQVDGRLAAAFLPDRRDEQVGPVLIRLPVRPRLRRARFHQEQRPHDRHAGGRRLARVPVRVVDEPLVQAGVEAPGRNQRRVVPRRARQVPEAGVARRPDLHDRGERAEGEPPGAHLLLHQLPVVAARVGAPHRVPHHRRPLHRDDRGPQPLLRAVHVAPPEHPVRGAAGVRRARHQQEVVAAVLLRLLVRRLQEHDGVGTAVVAQRAAVEHRALFLREVFVGAVELEGRDPQPEQLREALLPVRPRLGVGEVGQRVVVEVGPRVARHLVSLLQRLARHRPLEERADPEHRLHVPPVEPPHHVAEVRQARRVDLEVVVAVAARSPRAVDPVHAVRDPVRLHQQDVLHHLRVEGAGDPGAVVVARAVHVLVAPPPRGEGPLRRQHRQPRVAGVGADQRGRIGIEVDLHLERRSLEVDRHPVLRARAEPEVPARRPLDEHAVSAGRQVERRVQRGRSLHDHRHALAAQVHRLLEAPPPRPLLRAVHHPLHQPGEVLVRGRVERQPPTPHAARRLGGQPQRAVSPLDRHGQAHDPAVGQRRLAGAPLGEARRCRQRRRQAPPPLRRVDVEAVDPQRRPLRLRGGTQGNRRRDDERGVGKGAAGAGRNRRGREDESRHGEHEHLHRDLQPPHPDAPRASPPRLWERRQAGATARQAARGQTCGNTNRGIGGRRVGAPRSS